MSITRKAVDVWRMVGLEAESQSRVVTDTQREYEFLERYIDSGKPAYPAGEYHYLIKTPFRYDTPTPPQHSARFKPPEGNPKACYASREPTTTFYEVAYHWLYERLHLPSSTQTPEPRTLFSVSFTDPQAFDLKKDPNWKAISGKAGYQASWEFVRAHPDTDSIWYPSCRAPDGTNLFTRNIKTLGRDPMEQVQFSLVLRKKEKACYLFSTIQDLRWPSLLIRWDEVA
ncbi:MAG: RES family NAD+ phosphorylase [Proteobacteria bacterium]|nr:RES family NAD+ phosphorylase [Pseudomonadota bacterium]